MTRVLTQPMNGNKKWNRFRWAPALQTLHWLWTVDLNVAWSSYLWGSDAQVIRVRFFPMNKNSPPTPWGLSSRSGWNIWPRWVEGWILGFNTTSTSDLGTVNTSMTYRSLNLIVGMLASMRGSGGSCPSSEGQEDYRLLRNLDCWLFHDVRMIKTLRGL